MSDVTRQIDEVNQLPAAIKTVVDDLADFFTGDRKRFKEALLAVAKNDYNRAVGDFALNSSKAAQYVLKLLKKNAEDIENCMNIPKDSGKLREKF